MSVEELVDRHRLVCRPVRDLIVNYLCECAPAMDYGSLSNLTHWLAELFWSDLFEQHFTLRTRTRLRPLSHAAHRTQPTASAA